MSRKVTLTCDGCDWRFETDQVTGEPGRWVYDAPTHACENGCTFMTERVVFDADLICTTPMLNMVIKL